MPKPFENAEEVFFEQSDPRWGHLPYAGFTVSWAGCGLVAYTMPGSSVPSKTAT